MAKVIQIGSKNIYVEGDVIGNINIENEKAFPKELTIFSSLVPNIVVGRDKLLNSIFKKFESNSCLVLNGIGGIGKTTLAKKIISNNYKAFNHILWITFKEDIVTSFVNNIQLIDSLYLQDLRYNNIDNQKKFELIFHRINQLAGFNILIIDDLKYNSELEEYLHYFNFTNGWKTLITSRDSFEMFKSIQVESLNVKPAKKLFEFYYNGYTSDFLLEKIVKRIECHPLLIEVLSKSANFYRLELSKVESIIMGDFEMPNESKIFLYHPQKKIDDISKYLFKIFDYSDLNRCETTLLICLSLLAPIEIEVSFIKAILDNKYDEKEVQVALISLNEKGWIKYTLDIEIVKIHSAIQLVIFLKSELDFEKVKFIIDFFVYELIFNDSKIGYEYSYAFMLPHIESIIEKIKIENITISNLANNSTSVYKAIGDYSSALKSSHFAIRIAEKNNEELLLATYFSNIGITYSYLKDFEKAEFYGLKSVQIKERLLGKYDIGLAYSYNSLGHTALMTDNYESAINYFKKSIRIGEEKLQANHPLLLTYYNNISHALMESNKLKQAYYYGKKCVEKAELSLSSTNQDLVLYYSNFGHLLVLMDNPTEAFKYMNKAIELIENHSFKNHHWIATVYYNMAEMQFDYEDMKLSKKYYLKAIEVIEKYNASTHDEIYLIYNKLAMCCSHLKEYQESYEYYKQVIRTIEKETSNFNRSFIYNNMAVNFLQQKKFRKAQRYIEKCINFCNENTDFDYQHIPRYYFNYYLILKNIGHKEKAFEMLNESRKLIEYSNEQIKLLYLSEIEIAYKEEKSA